VVCGVHELPSHLAALCPVGPSPTTSQSLAEAHDTEPTKENPVTLESADQAEPFQRVTSPKPVTAMQNPADTQDTDWG
jgi:hypothetical protein